MQIASTPVSIENSFLAGMARLRAYWSLLKSLQTGLLLLTAIAGYISGCCLSPRAASMGALLGSLFLAIAGSTALNMAYDRDIDACMARTAQRPLPAGLVTPLEAWLLGGGMLAGGLCWALVLDPLYAAVVTGGAFLDVVVYTLWLKRRTPLALLLGGLSGGMPALAGRTLATGQIDALGLWLALGVLLWIPTHMMTFAIKHQADYSSARVPTFPAVYGLRVTRLVIALSTLLDVVVMVQVGWRIGLDSAAQGFSLSAGALLVSLVSLAVLRPSRGLNFALYKGASIYMLSVMLALIAGGL